VGLAAGAVAAGAGVIVAAERIAVGRARVLRDSAAPAALGQLRGTPLTVLTEDGVSLHVEIDEPTTDAHSGSGGQPPPVTIIFCHGYTLNQDCWHFQREGLRPHHRMVFWDQRDHGRSGRSAAGAASVGRLGADLDLVIKAVAPGDMPVVLVGHSMGGMTIMALAEQHPELFGTKVVGAVLVSTAARGLDAGSPWMPAPFRPVLRRAVPGVLRGASKGVRAGIVERGRQVSADLAFLGTRYIGFGDSGTDPAVIEFLEQMIRATPIEVIAAFAQALYKCDMRGSLEVLGKVPVVVVTGEKDRLIAPTLGLELAAQIPGADLVWVPGAGHAVILERPDIVNQAIDRLVSRATAGGGVAGWADAG
jgi:pimeloyl-ACP methyl ester carboxylesterase